MFKYRNVTISGLPGTGTTTLLHLLEERTEWKGYSGGEFMRAYAEEKGYYSKDNNTHHDATVYPNDFDRQIDYGVREKLQNGSEHIYEAWLSGFLAQGIPGVLKVLLVCSDDAVRVDRVVNRDQVTVADALAHIREREVNNREKWQKMYMQEWKEWVVKPGLKKEEEKIDFWDPRLYDLVIDTYSNSKEQTLQQVLDWMQWV